MKPKRHVMHVDKAAAVLLAVTLVVPAGCQSGASDQGDVGQGTTDPAIEIQRNVAPPEPDISPKQSGTCSVEEGDEETVVTYSATASWNGSLRFVQATHLRRSEVGDDVLNIISVSIGADEVLRHAIGHSHTGAVEVTMDYSEPLRGIRHGTLTSADGETAEMTLDGRKSLPFQFTDNPEIIFVDGEPPPELQMPDRIRQDIKRLLDESQAGAADCQSSVPEPSLSALPSEIEAVDRGHKSNTLFKPSCLTCIGACHYAGYNCGVGAASVAIGCFAGYPVCLAVGLAICIATEAACIHICRTSEVACCPVDCKATLFNEQCCDTGETCLNSNVGLCCSPGKSACNGQSCCAAGEECCGPTCCGLNQVCTDPVLGKCCDVGQTCGDACCLSASVCTNPATSTCCATDLGHTPCGTECCAPSEACVVDDKCCALEKACFGVCCSETETCDQTTQACRPSLCPIGERECGTSCCSAQTGCNPNTNTCCPENFVFCTRFNICTSPSQCIQ